MRSEKVESDGAAAAKSAARLDLPEGPVWAAAIFAHCFTCSKDLPAARRIAARPATPEGVVRVAEADARGFRQDVVIGRRHPLVGDEPASLGGTDLGPNPYQFLSAGLGACTTMTIRMYARRKGIADPCRLRRDA